MTAQQSLQIISETFNNSRKEILRGSAKYFMLWGTLLTVVSLVIYLLWHLTGKPEWNFLWFAMPVIGYPIAALMGKYSKAMPQNEVSKMLGNVWGVFGVFAITLSIIAIFLVPMRVSLIIVIIMGVRRPAEKLADHYRRLPPGRGWCRLRHAGKGRSTTVDFHFGRRPAARDRTDYETSVQIAYVSQVRSASALGTPAGRDVHSGGGR